MELAEFAREQGLFEQVHHALFKAFFEDGQDLGDREVLLGTGTGVGLDREALHAALEHGTYCELIMPDERRAQALGITAVPAMIVCWADQPLEAAEVISGAQPYEAVAAAVERAMRRSST